MVKFFCGGAKKETKIETQQPGNPGNAAVYNVTTLPVSNIIVRLPNNATDGTDLEIGAF